MERLLSAYGRITARDQLNKSIAISGIVGRHFYVGPRTPGWRNGAVVNLIPPAHTRNLGRAAMGSLAAPRNRSRHEIAT